MPGAPVFHGTAPTVPNTAQGMGGSARIQSSPTLRANDMSFFVWVFIIGILLPLLVIGGLKVGGFQFVFKHR